MGQQLHLAAHLHLVVVADAHLQQAGATDEAALVQLEGLAATGLAQLHQVGGDRAGGAAGGDILDQPGVVPGAALAVIHIQQEDEGRAQAELGARNACLLARNFLQAGFDVVISDVVSVETARVYRTSLPGLVVVRLAASLAEVTHRAETRPWYLTRAEFEQLHSAETAAAIEFDHVLAVGGLSLEEQVAGAEATWATATR